MRQTGFSDISWGKATRGYATSAKSLSNVKFDTIVQGAQDFLKPLRSRNKTSADATEVINVDDDDDERAHLIDNSESGSDVECTFIIVALPHCFFEFCDLILT
jgi:hypothetical protein